MQADKVKGPARLDGLRLGITLFMPFFERIRDHLYGTNLYGTMHGVVLVCGKYLQISHLQTRNCGNRPSFAYFRHNFGGCRAPAAAPGPMTMNRLQSPQWIDPFTARAPYKIRPDDVAHSDRILVRAVKRSLVPNRGRIEQDDVGLQARSQNAPVHSFNLCAHCLLEPDHPTIPHTQAQHAREGAEAARVRRGL